MTSSIEDIISYLNMKSNLDLNPSNYDAIMYKRMKTSNLLCHSEKVKEEYKKKGKDLPHQAHIAITGSDMDLFPSLYIRSYQSDDSSIWLQDGRVPEWQDDRVTKLKSFYYMTVPVTLYSKNFEYGDASKEVKDKFGSQDTKTVDMSVVLSKRKSGDFQLEIGHATKSDPLIKDFRKMFIEDDILVIAKEKKQSKYSAFIIRQKDDNNQFDDKPIFRCSKDNSTKVTMDSFHSERRSDGKNIIYYGAPGTGKSYEVNEAVKKAYPNYEVAKGNDYVFRVSLYPEYSYSDFVGQHMPRSNNKHEIEYPFVSGPFTQALEKAYDNPDKEVYLIVEEMSRANAAAVFGDLFQLLDRENGSSEYPINNEDIAREVYGPSKHKVTIPSNMTILGTVNTNDQNVFVMDTAFKRRFEWKYIPIDKGADSNEFVNPKIDIGEGNIKEWKDIYQTLNSFIVDKNDLGLSEDKQIGPFFIKFEDADSNKAHELFQDKLLQYLWEDINAAADVMDSSKKSLFQDNISSFSMLYKKFGDKEKVFSDALLNELGEKEKDNANKSAD